MTRYGQEQKGQKVQFEGSGTGRASQRLSTASVSDLDMTPSMRYISLPIYQQLELTEVAAI